VLARIHGSLDPLRALCDIEGVRYEMLTRDGAGAQVSLMHCRKASAADSHLFPSYDKTLVIARDSQARCATNRVSVAATWSASSKV
jgi:hypothetical protein